MISDEAVEAACEYLTAANGGAFRPDPAFVRGVLEAAAPHMHAQALEEAVAAFPLETIVAPDNAVVWMMRRAEEIRSQA